MSGPPKTAPQLKVLAGTFRQDRDAPPAVEGVEPPQFDLLGNLPPAPRGIGAEGRKMWTHLGGMLMRCGMLQAPDVYALELLCLNWSQLQEMKRRKDPVPNSFTNTLMAQFNQFGITLASRNRLVRRMGDAPPPNNPFSGHGKRPGAPA